MTVKSFDLRTRLGTFKWDRRAVVAAGAGVTVLIVTVILIGRALTTPATTTSLQTATVERGTLSATVSAAGNIEARQLAALKWNTSGIVGAVHVQVGDSVRAGDVLVELSPDSLDPAVLRAQSELITAQKALAELEHPTQLDIANAQQAVANAQEALARARSELYSAQNPAGPSLQDAVASAKFTLDQAQAGLQLASVDPNVAAWQNAVFLANWFRRRWEDLQAQYDASNGNLELKDQLDQAYNDYQAKLNNQLTLELKINTDKSGKQESVDRAQTAYDTAVKNLAAAQAGPDQIKLALAEAKAAVAEGTLADTQSALDKLQNGADPADLIAARAKVETAQVTVNLARLSAPFAGMVADLSSRVGDSVSTGNAAVTIADRSTLQVTVDVSEVDINSLAVGQPAALTLDAVPNQSFAGVVSEVGAVGVVQQGVVNFPVTILIENPDPAIKPGMTAGVSITTEQRDNALLVPNRAIRASGGQRVVVVLFEGQQFTVQVTVGLSNDTHSEIMSGTLKEGDTLLLNSSGAAAQTGGGLFGLFGGGGGGGGFRGP